MPQAQQYNVSLCQGVICITFSAMSLFLLYSLDNLQRTNSKRPRTKPAVSGIRTNSLTWSAANSHSTTVLRASHRCRTETIHTVVYCELWSTWKRPAFNWWQYFSLAALPLWLYILSGIFYSSEQYWWHRGDSILKHWEKIATFCFGFLTKKVKKFLIF